MTVFSSRQAIHYPAAIKTYGVTIFIFERENNAFAYFLVVRTRVVTNLQSFPVQSPAGAVPFGFVASFYGVLEQVQGTYGLLSGKERQSFHKVIYLFSHGSNDLIIIVMCDNFVHQFHNCHNGIFLHSPACNCRGSYPYA